jgi:hypothetical protein
MYTNTVFSAAFYSDAGLTSPISRHSWIVHE